MLHSIPGNRLEDLTIVLAALLRETTLTTRAALEPQRVVVPHPGLALWLRRTLAAQPERRVAMNLEFLLPREWVWGLLRETLGPQAIPEQSPFAPEILRWRLFDHLGSPEVIADPNFAEPSDAWRCAPERQQALRRFQLAQELATLFDQMTLYRPDWLLAFERGADTVPDRDRTGPTPCPDWQALLWQRLIRETPIHPLALLQKLRDVLFSAASGVSSPVSLPESVIFFGTHTLPPLWLDVLSALARAGVDVHVLHLNPCDDYWDDAESPRDRLRRLMRVAARQRAPYRPGEERPAAPFSWDTRVGDSGEAPHAESISILAKGADASLPSALRLLTTLGAQGQQFIRALHERADLETPVFSHPSADASGFSGHPLHDLQTDLLRAPDASRAAHKRPAPDERLVIVRAPNRLREVEGLHDWLLARLADDPTLRLRDVAVVCPDVAAYAPILRAVFTSPGQTSSTAWDAVDASLPATPRLPCTIADRAAQDEDADLAVLSALLRVDDERFSRQTVIEWLRSPALAARFGLTPDDREALSNALHDAGGFWGLHAEQRGEWLHGEPEQPFTLDAFDLENAIRRGLLAFARGREAYEPNADVLVDEATTRSTAALPDDIDDDEAARLSRLAQMLAVVNRWRRQLGQARRLPEWVRHLHDDLRHALFAEGSDFEALHEAIRLALERLLKEADAAKFEDAVAWPVVRHAFENALERTLPRAGRGFMRGAVTVASLVPMRSVPFRLIAVLGLDADAFPRNTPPLGFDRIAQSRPRALDRSRRTDDRQLFLETLLSAREGLWLSYVAYDPKDRTERAPSLVLSLLLDHLEAVTAFNRERDVRELPLHAFDVRRFRPSATVNGRPTIAGFAGEWLRLAHAARGSHDDAAAIRPVPVDAPEPGSSRPGTPRLTGSVSDQTAGSGSPAKIDEMERELELDDLARAHADPAADWARHALGLRRLDDAILSEDEAFEVSALERYTLLDEVIRTHLAQAFSVSPPSSYGVTANDPILRRALERRRQLGRWPVTQRLDADCAAWQPVIEDWLQVLLDGLQGPPEPCPVRHRIGSAWLVGEIERLPVTPSAWSHLPADPSSDADAIEDRSGDDDPARDRDAVPSLIRLWRPGKPKAAFVVSAWLTHLVANLHRPTWTELIAADQDTPRRAYVLRPVEARGARADLERLVDDLSGWRAGERPPIYDAELVTAWAQIEHERRAAEQAGDPDAAVTFADAFAQALQERWTPENQAHNRRRDTAQPDGWARDPLRSGLWTQGPPDPESLAAALRARFSRLVDAMRVLK